MARSHGKVLATIWLDEDFKALSSEAQRLYLLLLSQSKLSIVGVIDYFPSRWAALASDTDAEDIEEAASELEQHRFVVIDRATDELLVRTIVKHDLTPARLNVNLVKGVWNAWIAVTSPELRSVILETLPEVVWTWKDVEPPALAMQMRRSASLERPVATDCPDDPSERPVGIISRPSTVSNHLSLSPCPDDPLPKDLWQLYASKALREHKGIIRNQGAWIAATEARAAVEERERAEHYWRTYTLTTSELVDALLAPSPPQWLNGCRRPA